MSETLERITKVQLPYDRRQADPAKNYGVGGLTVWYILRGDRGAVQFACIFPTFLPHVELDRDEIIGLDVGYHSKVPQYDGQGTMSCDIFECGECYYDGSSLRAREWVEIIFSTVGEHPEDVMWPMLEAEYYSRFGGES